MRSVGSKTRERTGVCLRRSATSGWLPATVLALAAACLPGRRQSDLPFPDVSKPRPTQVGAAAEKDIAVTATAQGNVLSVTVTNQGDAPILVAPNYFTVRVGGEKDYPVDAATMATRFPVRRLRRGETASGVVKFQQLPVLAGEELTFDTPDAPPVTTRIKQPIEITAEAHGNVLWVTVINNTDKAILVGPKYFAVRVGGRVYPVHPARVATRFPIRQLGCGEGTSGLFRFDELTSLVDEQLVLNSPDAQPVVAKIKPRRAGVPPPLQAPPAEKPRTR